jgi:hypothetical protein
LAIDVVDSGIGIAEQERERIFEPFYQTKGGAEMGADTKMGAGTGLGLALRKEYVATLDGELFAESRPGEGSVFRVMVPVRPSEERPQVANSSETQGRARALGTIDMLPIELRRALHEAAVMLDIDRITLLNEQIRTSHSASLAEAIEQLDKELELSVLIEVSAESLEDG